MDGLVLSVAIGFRSYGGDGITDWLAAIGGIATAVSAFAILITFLYSVKSGNILKARTTLDQSRKLMELIYDSSLDDVRKGACTLKKIYNHYEIKNELPDEHYEYFSKLESLAYNLLLELEATNELIGRGVIDKNLLKSYVGGAIAHQYESFFKFLVKIGIKRTKGIYENDPENNKAYENTWSGIIALMEELNSPTQTRSGKMHWGSNLLTLVFRRRGIL